MSGCAVDADPARVDADAAWAFLSTEAYWGTWRTRTDFDRQAERAWRLVGAYEPDSGRMVGFARAISDGVAFAYLADVYVLPAHRGHGLGSALVWVMIDEGSGAAFRWMLHTADAHGLYAKYGFAEPERSAMQRSVPQPEASR